MNIEKDVCREGVTGAKVLHYLRLLCCKKLTQALVSYSKFEDVDISEFKKRRIELIILDVDECIAPHHGDILPQNIDKLQKMLESGLKIVIYSNMKDNGRYSELENMGIKVLRTHYAKPDPRGFLEAMNELGISDTSKVLMIGDNFATDGGSISAGISFAKIDAILTGDKGGLKRKAQKIFRQAVDWISIIRGNRLPYGKFRE